MSDTNGNLPNRLDPNVDCKSNGNSPATLISIGGPKTRKTATLASSMIETVTNVVRVPSSSVIHAEEGAVVGDPAQNGNRTARSMF